MKIEFVKYDWERANLCRGRLVVKIDGQPVSFGVNDPQYLCPGEELADYPRFWMSGGHLEALPDWEGFERYEGPWISTIDSFNKDQFPEKILEAVPQMLELMNENVPWGCCGGCS